jgi:hypothetical protein
LIKAQSTSPSSAQPKLRLGYVKDHDVGCGAAFSLKTTDLRNSRYIFVQDSGEPDEPTYINLNGKNLQLRLIDSNKPKGREKIGDRWWETYTAGDVTVRIDYTVTKIFQHEFSDSLHLNATMTVSLKAQKTTVKLIGFDRC